ncbi:MAG: primosomal protein N' [Oligosphaeraceae bacterium]|nr:primosomal protein N' [Oligosphaeraceae bacterium]
MPASSSKSASRSLPLVAEVAFDRAINRGLDYRIPEALASRVHPGSRVMAPLRNEVLPGYVIRIKLGSKFAKLKSILSLESDAQQIPDKLLELAEWISNYYCCNIESAIWAMLPAVVRRGEMKHRQLDYVTLTAKALRMDEEFEALSKKRQAILRAIQKVGALPVKELLGLVEASETLINNLCKDEWLTKEKRVVERNPFRDNIIQPDQPKKLNADQTAALASIKESLRKRDSAAMLLHGVTGSGKTEVYLQAIQYCLELEREAIVLVPEIALTPQTCDRFRQRFGNLVSVLHSGLSDGERFDEWNRINEGRSPIVVGARSAIFAPLRKLGLIVVDEEHENSYKQEEAPCYNARDMAVLRGKKEHASIILGTATPSLETYYNCQQGRYQLLEMSQRIDARPMPRVEIIDMCQERAQSGQGGIFSGRLIEQINETLFAGEQVMLFLNRRGFATQMSCNKCGYTAGCQSCSVSYTYHRKKELLLCHHCGAEVPAPQKCPQCENPEIRYQGYGTEKIESIARAIFPQALVARMDSDSMTSKDSYRDVLAAFRKGHINILIGTQMIAKGLDFPNVTLVGLIQADMGLNMPDFRSAERSFQLITQMGGRAGRGNKPGLVIVQTFSPQHYALRAAQKHDFKQFYEEEMPSRKALEFPPYSRMLMLRFRAEDEKQLQDTAEAFAKKLRALLGHEAKMIGPMPAPIAKINNFFRYQILLRSKKASVMLNAVRACLQDKRNRKVHVSVDMDPKSLL